jgi:beta-galactosidase
VVEGELSFSRTSWLSETTSIMLFKQQEFILNTDSSDNMKIIFAVFVLLTSSIVAYTQIPNERKQLFDYDWKFFLGDSSAAKSKDFNDKAWRNLDLPHDWSIEGKVNPKNPTGGGGGYFPAGIGWYRKTFNAPLEWKGKKVSIYFEGVYMNSEVFVNGKSLGVYPYGYSSFSYDLSAHLEFGSVNVIAIRVDNSQHVNSRWYSGSGIYRHVWMNVTDQLHVANWGVAIKTSDVSSKKATVEIKTLVQNETRYAQSVVVKTQIQNKNLKNVANQQLKVEIPANSEKEVTQVINISNPLLWTPETPTLYTAQVQLMTENKVIDETENIFGIRSIEFTSAKGFLLNGKTVKMNGGCVHHDNGCLGAAAFDRAEERKVELLKSAGFNAVRTSHNPPSEAFLNACDRVGLLVMDEAFDCWRIGKNKNDYAKYFDQWWKRDLEAMVLRDRNHPSIIMWSIGNEIPERGSPEAVKTATMLANAVKQIDASRPVTSAIVVNDKEWTAFDPLMAAHDVAGYNYHLDSAPADHERVPSRIIVHTESYPQDAFKNWKLVQTNNYVIGDFVWTAMDYLGESGIGRWYYSGDVPGEHWEHDFFPWHGAYCGDIDLMGWRKPISHYRNLLYNSNEKLYMAVREPNPEPLEIKQTWWSVWPTWESWTWPGFEGKNIQVEVYSKYTKVRLYLNDKLIGEKATTIEEGYKATFTLPYSAGKLKAVGVEHDKEVESTVLHTSREASKIKLTTDRKEILANGQDLSYVTVEVTDNDGVIQPNAVNRLHFKIEGPGIIAGVDNADMKDYELYVNNSRKAWHGRALVVIKSTRSTGDIKLTVTSPGLSDSVIDIKTISNTTKAQK